MQEGEPNPQRTTVTDPIKSAAGAPSIGAVSPPASSPPQAAPAAPVQPVAAASAATPSSNANVSTAEAIRNSILKSQPFGGSSVRSQSKHNTVTPSTSSAAGSTSSRAGAASTPVPPPARNSRPQQPPIPPFGGSGISGAKPGLTSTEDANIRVDGGWMVLRVVPDDKYVTIDGRSFRLRDL